MSAGGQERRAGKGDWLAARGQKPDQGRTQGFWPSRERLHSEVVRASRGPQWCSVRPPMRETWVQP